VKVELESIAIQKIEPRRGKRKNKERVVKGRTERAAKKAERNRQRN
jgi:hypothetical protein